MAANDTPTYAPPVARTRREQMYFTLTDSEIDRLRRFGEPGHYAPGDYLVHAGETGLGMFVILSGEVEVSRRDGLGTTCRCSLTRPAASWPRRASSAAPRPSSTPAPWTRSKPW